MKILPVPLLVRLVASTAALLLVAACGKQETARVDPPKPAAAAPETPSASTPAQAPVKEPAIVPAAPAPKPVATPATTPEPAARKTASKEAVPAVFVRTGPLAKTRRLADFVGTLRSGETSLKLTLHSDETWTIRQPVDDVDLVDLPQLINTPWLHLETTTGGVLVPFAALKSISLTPVSQEKEKARARLVLQDGTELTGVVRGRVSGNSELGRLEAPWRALKEVELISRDGAAPAEALPLAGKGVALLNDGTRLEFTSWAPVIGDVVSDVLLAESGTGPEIVPLANVNSVEFVGSDSKAFFYQHAVTLTASGQTSARRNVALTCVLVQLANGCVVCLAPTVLLNITRP